MKQAQRTYANAPKWLYGVVGCRDHVDREAVIVFQKAGNEFGFCGPCARLQKGRRFVGLVVGHGYTARPVQRAAHRRRAVIPAAGR